MDGLLDRSATAGRVGADVQSHRARIVIVGAGFGGLSAAMGLARAAADVTIVDRRNYHLFQPLLYQVATAALSPADIAAPIRRIFRGRRNSGDPRDRERIDVAGRAVLIGERAFPTTSSFIATGAREAYFGHDEWAGVDLRLKKYRRCHRDPAAYPDGIRTRREQRPMRPNAAGL